MGKILRSENGFRYAMACNVFENAPVTFQGIGKIIPVIGAPEWVAKQGKAGLAPKNFLNGSAGVFAPRRMG
ncbi:MAG: hypothetical protein BM558_00190 [Roseobacter sp. MedPE-SW]|nr:MAG: hypothetical protein BM558_00190 [Roseobacter sp. MedPE-SW]